ncbi:autotransporter outer membrane beta-barrel domain-containing protein [Halococcus hamelinensis]|uniref:Right handed beta helix domain-containing protein n=1 Tax=Halococcus hamelinensis 100A6 TaxID=1132509 RepID=M0LVN1_9EURY|nr:hypothetical protein [Halococcus hamelinensis]EMA36424.1 hypothetical protein C447_14231 [Halococcus hamelinensis 100A6]
MVQYEGGTYRNNDNNQIRLGSENSYIDGASLEVDADASEAPNPDEALNYRGVRIEMGHNYTPVDVSIRNCEISVRSTPQTGGAIVAESTAGHFEVRNTRIGVDPDGVRAVLGKEPDGGAYEPPAEPHSAVFEDVDITGSASGNEAIRLVGRPDSLVDGCRIAQDGSDRDGVALVDSPGTAINETVLDVTGTPVTRENSPGVDDFTVEDISSVDTPSEGTGSDDTDSSDGDAGGSGSEPGLRWSSSGELTIEAPGDGGASYLLTVGDNLEPSTDNGATIDDTDDVSRNTAMGQVGDGGIDSYTFDGGILAFEMDGDAALTLNDQEITADQLPDNTITIASDGGRSTYDLAVSVALGKSDAMNATVDDNDDLSGSHVTGQVDGGGRDSYGFSGEITGFDLDGNATVYRNGEEVDPDDLPTETLSITSTGESASYRFTVGGDVERTTTNGATVDDNDVVDGKTVTGQVGGGGRDSYSISGGVLSFEMDGDALIYLNDREMEAGQFSNNTITIASDGGRSSYRLAASVALGKSDAMNATVDDNDDLSGAHATGQVDGGGRDSYGFSGEITAFSQDGDASVYLDSEAIDPDSLPDNTLTVSSQGGRSTYEFTVDGDVEKTTTNGATVDDNDAISGDTVSGQVGGGGRDSYSISGTVSAFDIDGDAALYFNDEEVAPGDVTNR